MPHRPDVDVDEARMRIVADAAASKGKSYTPQRQRVDAGHAQVNGLPWNVKAIFGEAWGTSPSLSRSICWTCQNRHKKLNSGFGSPLCIS